MTTHLPRLVIAAPASGHGKTTIATGLMAALSRAGMTVSGHKVGPDYIDPGYHALATGRPGRNLDPHLVGEERLVPLLLHGSTGADLAVIEGVMGLYDGQLGTDGFSSTAHVAAVTRTPVVLVVDISHASRSIAATVHGLRTWDPSVNIVGVILNKAGSVRHSDEVVRALAGSGLPVLGVLQRDDGVSAPSRHLGLVPAAERADAAASLDRLAAQVAERVDLAEVVRLAKSAPDLVGEPWDASPPLVEEGAQRLSRNPETPDISPPRSVVELAETPRISPPPPVVELAETPRISPPLVEEGAQRLSRNPETPGISPSSMTGNARPVIAIAGGRAFTFAYAETTELLRAAGCDPVVFDPTTDVALPDGTQGLYLGGGFPEMHAGDLSGNEQLRHQIRAAIAAGLPTVAECAGLLYLCRSVDGSPMVGAIDADAAMAPRLTLAYRHATSATTNLLGRPGETVTGHEFHRTRLLTAPANPAWDLGPDLNDGVATETLHASYLHTHWAGHPQLAARFVAAVRAAAPASRSSSPAPRSSSLPRRGDLPAPPAEGFVTVAIATSSTTGQVPSATSSTSGPLVEERGTSVTKPGSVTVASAGSADERALRHHGDTEATPGLLDFAVNVYDGPRPTWLETAIAAADLGRYPDASPARTAVADLHGLDAEQVLPTAGAAEAFGLIARLRPWRRPVVVHPQFTEPDVALSAAGHQVEHVLLRAEDGFTLAPDTIPATADLVVIGNPTNPTGVRHPAATIRQLLAPGRLVVVDEAFLDDGTESLAAEGLPGLVVIRSLTKLWSIPGVRAGYLLGEPEAVAALADLQTPWSVSATAVAALVATSTPEAQAEAVLRVETIEKHRADLVAGLENLGITYVADSTAPFVLARPGTGVHAALRDAGIAVRRADTFPGLDENWIRIAVREPALTGSLLAAFEHVMTSTRRTH